jgi:hypothetical protein
MSPPLLTFCLGWSSNFVGSVQIQNVKLLQNMVSNRTRHILYFDTGKEGEVNYREKVREATVHKAGSKIPT